MFARALSLGFVMAFLGVIGQGVPRDPQALAWVNQALAALSGGTSLSDVTLEATVTYTAGSDVETGSATLEALGDTDGLAILNLSGGQRQEIRNGNAGAWWGTTRVETLEATHNCYTDASWFFPGLVLTALSTNGQMALLNLGTGTWNGQPANHVQSYLVVTGQPPDQIALIQALSTEDLYLDPTSGLPLAVDFNIHPDDNALANIPQEIRFSNYQPVNGRSVPFHVQEFVQGSLLLDITVTSTTVNSGIPLTQFFIPPIGGTQ